MSADYLFDFEHLDVYKLTMELLPISEILESKLRSVRPNLASQLGRAVDSLQLNLAEGAVGSGLSRFEPRPGIGDLQERLPR